MTHYRHEIIKPDELLEVKLFTFKANSYDRVIAPHWHASVEVLYCVSGQLLIQTDAKQYLLEEDDVFLLNSNVVHSTSSPQKNHILVIQLPLKFMARITENEYNQSYLFELNSVDKKVSKAFLQQIKVMLNHLQDSTTEGRLSIKIDLYNMLLLLLKENKQALDAQKNLKSQENQRKLMEIIHFIKENYQRDLSLTEVANVFNYSTTYFSRFFKKMMGTNFSEYLALIRIEHAQNLLIHSEWTIMDIAFSSGFNNVRTFFGTFEKYHQMSPSAFRKKGK